MDKNPEYDLDNISKILDVFSKKNPNMVFSYEPFLKSQFLIEFINSSDNPIIFLDFDLLYTGYVLSDMISKKNNVELYQPDKNNLNNIFSNVITKISQKKHLVILDSLNGLYNLLPEIDSGIFVNAVTMLLTSVSRQMDSMIVITGMARKKEKEGWILLPGGRHIIESKNSSMFLIKNFEKSHLKLMKA